MKKFKGALTVLLFLILLTSVAVAEEVKRNGFRHFEWGTSIETVIAEEEKDSNTELMEQKENKIIFQGMEFGHKVRIIYEFAEGYGLFQGTYELVEKNLPQTSMYLERYREIEKAIVAKFGDFHDKQMHWRVELYKNQPDEWGRAVAMRHLNMGQAWFFESLLLGHFLLEGNRFLEVNHRILFVDPNFEGSSEDLDL